MLEGFIFFPFTKSRQMVFIFSFVKIFPKVLLCFQRSHWQLLHKLKSLLRQDCKLSHNSRKSSIINYRGGEQTPGSPKSSNQCRTLTTVSSDDVSNKFLRASTCFKQYTVHFEDEAFASPTLQHGEARTNWTS